MYRVDREPVRQKQPLLPMGQTPGLFEVLFHSLTGLIILINTLVFVFISIETGDIMSPSLDSLAKYGARDTVLVANGEYFRILTANFLHIGLLHYLFNNYALYIVGWNLEKMWGKSRFLLLYLLSGLCGNVLSQLYSINISAGASASIFGLFGSGLLVEWKLKKKLQHEGVNTANFNSSFAGLVVLNIILGLVIPNIDNAAHMGGLIGGVVVTYSYFLFLDNTNSRNKRSLSVAIILLLSAAITIGGYYGGRKDLVEIRITDSLNSADTPYKKYYLLSRLVELLLISMNIN